MASTEVLHCNDSKSLWNYTLSPGWTKKEVEVFRCALMKFGMGCWTQIVESRCLPGKTVAQLNNQMQRMIGQQSTGEFMKCHIDPADVFAYNKTRHGRRKNGCLVNTGDNRTKEWYKKKRAENKEKWGLTKEQIDAVVIPTLLDSESSNVVIKTTSASASRLQKYDRIKILENNIKTYQMALENARTKDTPQDTTEEKEEKEEAKSKAKAKPKTKTKAKKKKAEKSQEELDAELARKLQQEEEGFMMDIDEDDDEDFEQPKKKRGRRKSKK